MESPVHGRPRRGITLMPVSDPATLTKIKSYLASTLAQEMENRPFGEEPRREALKELTRICTTAGIRLEENERDLVFSEVIDNVLGYGPIQPLLNDPTISE